MENSQNAGSLPDFDEEASSKAGGQDSNLGKRQRPDQRGHDDGQEDGDHASKRQKPDEPDQVQSAVARRQEQDVLDDQAIAKLAEQRPGPIQGRGKLFSFSINRSDAKKDDDAAQPAQPKVSPQQYALPPKMQPSAGPYGAPSAPGSSYYDQQYYQAQPQAYAQGYAMPPSMNMSNPALNNPFAQQYQY